MKIVAIWVYSKLTVNKKLTSFDPSAVKKKTGRVHYILELIFKL